MSCFSGSNILKSNFRMYPSLHDTTWPQDGTPSLWYLKLESYNHLQSFCVALCAHGWRGLSSLRLHLLLSWRDETHTASFSLCHHLLPVRFISSPWPRSSVTPCLSAKKQKSEEPKLTMYPFFFLMVYISSWKSEAKIFGNILFWCFHTKNTHK